MSDLRLKTLTLTNFKGIRDLTINANGADFSTYGENGTGKTTEADAFYWLLFGKDTLGRKDHEIKTIGFDGEVIHFLEHSVECSFEMSDGETLTLSRTYKEDWETQRGSSTKSFKGHTTTYEINGVPQSATEYAKFINSICDEGTFRLLTDPANFLSLSWQDRRKMLFDVCGDMTDADVIASDPDLTELGKLLGKHTVADLRKIADSQRTKIREERTQLPARIDEAMRSIPAEDKTDWQTVYAAHNEELSKLQEQRAKVVAGGYAADLRSKVVDIQTKQRSRLSELRSTPNPAREEAVKAQREQSLRKQQAADELSDISGQVATLKRKLENKTRETQALRDRVLVIKKKAYNGSVECPSCGRELPQEDIELAVEEFNGAKAREIEEITTQGKALVAEENDLKTRLALLENSETTARLALTDIQNELPIIIPEQSEIDPLTDPQYILLAGEIVSAQGALDIFTKSSASDIAKIDNEITRVHQLVIDAQTGMSNTQRRLDVMARVEQLKTDEKRLAGLNEQLERTIYLCDQFVRAKVRLLTDHINSRFNLTTFRLFREQINGGLQECCDVLWRESGALPSHGQSIQIGLDIIATLSDHIGFYPPVVIDNAESLTSFPDIKGQKIKLVVSSEDKELRVVIGSASADLGLYLADQEPALF